MFRQQQHQEHPSGAAQWAAHRESIPCSQYLCKTLECVKNPAYCPCPDVEDIGCVIPDADDPESGTVVCVRGKDGCDQVERLAWLGASWK
ncbi:Long chronological lifespan protein 2 [Marasmius tenuissimus]|nr:Long chronological lifespan protein 2 [Marasmius tenuissimus]